MRTLSVLAVVVVLVSAASLSHKAVAGPRSGAFCQFCESLMDQLEDMLNDQEKVDEQKIDALCQQNLPDFAADCAKYLKEEMEEILRKFEAEETPETICHQIGLCKN